MMLIPKLSNDVILGFSTGTSRTSSSSSSSLSSSSSSSSSVVGLHGYGGLKLGFICFRCFTLLAFPFRKNPGRKTLHRRRFLAPWPFSGTFRFSDLYPRDRQQMSHWCSAIGSTFSMDTATTATIEKRKGFIKKSSQHAGQSHVNRRHIWTWH